MDIERGEAVRSVASVNTGERIGGGSFFNQNKPNTKNTMINQELVAEELYETYCTAVGGVAFNGDALPNWKAFRADPSKKKQSDAWMAAAGRAMSLLMQ